MKDFLIRAKYDELQDHRKWMGEIPFFSFPPEWEVQITPPFGGAVVRFRVKLGVAHVSVYLDCYDHLGCYGEPYWEVYPHEGDVYRCDMGNIDELLSAIKHSIKEQENELPNREST
jgi:hypothetical protein